MSVYGSLEARWDVVKSERYREQAMRVLNSFWADKFGESEENRESIWALANKCEEVDAKKGEGNALDQFQANRVIEALLNDAGDSLTFKEVRDAIAKTGFEPSSRSLSLIEFAVFKFGFEPKQIILAEQTDADAVMAAAGDRWTAADAAATAAAAREAAAATAVEKAAEQLSEAAAGREEIAFLEEALAGQLAALELGVANAQGAVKGAKAKSELAKFQKAGEPDALRTLKSRNPIAQKKGAKAKAAADGEHAAAAKAKSEADDALEHATSDSELATYQVAGCGDGTAWFEAKEVKAKAVNR